MAGLRNPRGLLASLGKPIAQENQVGGILLAMRHGG
jgi:hypothetical protein